MEWIFNRKIITIEPNKIKTINFSSKGIQSFFVAGLIATAAFGVGLMLKETLEKYKK